MNWVQVCLCYMNLVPCFQDICNEWKDKSESEQEYQPFYRAVSAAAFSTGTQLKTRLQVMNWVQVCLCLMNLVSRFRTSVMSGRTSQRVSRSTSHSTELYLLQHLVLVPG